MPAQYALGSRLAGQGSRKARRLHTALRGRFCLQPALRPQWSHELKFDGYRLIARKDGNQVGLWTRPRSDYSGRLRRIRDAIAALPVDGAVLDGEAVVLR